MKRGLEPTFIAWRFYLLIFFILLIAAGLLVRVADLTFFKQKFLRKQSNERILRVINVPAFRGMIIDKNGYPLAISTRVYSVWVNPKEFVMEVEHLKPLSQKLGLTTQAIKTLIQSYQKKGREFVYLKRDVIPEIADKIKSMKIPGVYLQQGFKRFYPEGEVTAHVVGVTNVDDQGQEGLELSYNQWLSGSPGKEIVIKDRLGRIISGVERLEKQKPGNDLHLSIDHRLQYLAYRELMQGVQKNLAVSGSAVIIDTQTGEILAMVNQPSYNPNGNNDHKAENRRNRVVTDVYEPGSTVKAFSVATILQSGRYKSDSVVDTGPGWLKLGRNIVRSDHGTGPMTLTEILQTSNNVGIAKMILSLPQQHLYDLLHQVGFGEVTGINFPGERAGVLTDRTNWKPFALATFAIGYGLSVTPLQLAQAYTVLANGGEKKPLSLLSVDHPVQGQIVMDPKIAKQILLLLESVVSKGGTGELARIQGYRVAGKTGTARIAGENGYEKHSHVSSFVGIAPVSHPRLVVAVIINNPKGKEYYAATVTAPVFKNIMEGALRILNVKPDAAIE